MKGREERKGREEKEDKKPLKKMRASACLNFPLLKNF
jgi:hypothetical protein